MKKHLNLILAGVVSVALSACGAAGEADYAAYAKDKALPEKFVEFANAELAELTFNLPDQGSAPTVEQLYPALVGSQVLEYSDELIVLVVDTENPLVAKHFPGLEPTGAKTKPDDAVRVAFEKGNVAIDGILYQQCSWLNAYLVENKAGNKSQQEEAVKQLKKLAEDPVYRKYNPQLGDALKTEIIPQLINKTGIEAVQRFVDKSCHWEK